MGAAATHADPLPKTTASTTNASSTDSPPVATASVDQSNIASEPTPASTAEPASAAATDAANGTDAPVARIARRGRQPPLDLTPPDIRTVMPASELEQPLPTEEQQEQAQEGATVQVEGAKNTPDVPGGFGALWWALRHPSQAWRIFTPVE